MTKDEEFRALLAAAELAAARAAFRFKRPKRPLTWEAAAEVERIALASSNASEADAFEARLIALDSRAWRPSRAPRRR